MVFFHLVCLGGSERIRTAVEAFAELCLATRPQNLFVIPKTNAQREIFEWLQN